MRKAVLALAVACLASAAHAGDAAHDHEHAHGGAPHWTYDGANGPAHWAQINNAFQTCESGRAESPIDIRSAKKAPDGTPRIQFSYEPMPVHLLNTGHAIQFAAQPGKDSVTLGDTRYQLVQFHFHSPGEERFAGRASPMDMHLVHSDENGKLLVVAVQFVVGDKPNAVLGALLDDIPEKAGEEKTDDALMINPAGLLPKTASSYYTYSGSLTTPPCSEGVTWIELKEPVTISRAQLEAMRKFYYHNQRPVQPLNGREILEVD
jgi:carbonic anhydrase